jgi:hypothetical protein
MASPEHAQGGTAKSPEDARDACLGWASPDSPHWEGNEADTHGRRFRAKQGDHRDKAGAGH